MRRGNEIVAWTVSPGLASGTEIAGAGAGAVRSTSLTLVCVEVRKSRASPSFPGRSPQWLSV